MLYGDWDLAIVHQTELRREAERARLAQSAQTPGAWLERAKPKLSLNLEWLRRRQPQPAPAAWRADECQRIACECIG